MTYCTFKVFIIVHHAVTKPQTKQSDGVSVEVDERYVSRLEFEREMILLFKECCHIVPTISVH